MDFVIAAAVSIFVWACIYPNRRHYHEALRTFLKDTLGLPGSARGVEFIQEPTPYDELWIATLKDHEGNLVQLFDYRPG